MKIFLNTLLVIGSLVLMGFVLLIVLGGTGKDKPSETDASSAYAADSRRIAQSNQVIEPYDLARIPTCSMEAAAS